MTSIHQLLNQENLHERESAVERIQSRWSSSSRVIADRPPSQPLSRRQMSRRPSRSSVNESCHNDPGLGTESAVGRLQRGHSQWTSGSGVVTDSPPLQPLSRRESAVGKLQQSGSRWSSGPQAIVLPNRVSALKHSASAMNHDIFETATRALCILNLSRRHLSHMASGTGTELYCTVSPSA
jgi:hypothetical protein